MNLEDMEKIKHYADILITAYAEIRAAMKEKEKPSPRSAGFKGGYEV
jgi:hypothetical protein